MVICKWRDVGNPRSHPHLVLARLVVVLQEEWQVDYRYMSHQTNINEKMRMILIDWLVEVHVKYKQQPETLFLAVNIVDRYLSRRLVARGRLQLIGIAAMLIASKYEQVFRSEVRAAILRRLLTA